MPAGQTYRLLRHQWAQYRPKDPNVLSLLSVDQDVNIAPAQACAGYLQRYRGRVWNQWPVYSRDVNPLQSTDQPSVDLVPWKPTTATYLRWRGNVTNQWPVLSRNDPNNLGSADQDVTLVPWVPPTETYQRYRGKVPWAQWPVYSRDVNPLQSQDQDVNLVPVSARMWRPPSRAGFQQWPVYSRLDPTGLELADQDVTLRPVPWQWYRLPLGAQWRQFRPTDQSNFAAGLPDQDVNLRPVAWQWYRVPLGAQWRQLFPTDQTPFTSTLPDQDVNLNSWLLTTASYVRYKGRPWRSQWPVLSRDVTSLQSVDQPLLDLVPWRQTTASFLRWRGRVWNQWPIYSIDANQVVSADQDVNLVPILTRPQTREARAQWKQFTPTDPIGLELADLLQPLLRPPLPRTPYPPFRFRRQLPLVLDPSFFSPVVVIIPREGVVQLGLAPMAYATLGLTDPGSCVVALVDPGSCSIVLVPAGAVAVTLASTGDADLQLGM